jgi:hypothetical protein
MNQSINEWIRSEKESERTFWWKEIFYVIEKKFRFCCIERNKLKRNIVLREDEWWITWQNICLIQHKSKQEFQINERVNVWIVNETMNMWTSGEEEYLWISVSCVIFPSRMKDWRSFFWFATHFPISTTAYRGEDHSLYTGKCQSVSKQFTLLTLFLVVLCFLLTTHAHTQKKYEIHSFNKLWMWIKLNCWSLSSKMFNIFILLKRLWMVWRKVVLIL